MIPQIIYGSQGFLDIFQIYFLEKIVNNIDFYVNYDILVKVIKIYSHLLLLRGF